MEKKVSSQTIPTSFTTEDYLMPEWGGLPKHSFHFEVIKDGCLLSTIPIRSKEFSLVGRLEDLCDIFIDNPTVSRKHAILQFHQQQSLPYLYDLGNTHGTYVNKEKLLPRVFKKLQPYCNIKFGISSRYYILRCPQLEQKQAQQEQEKEEQFIKQLAHQCQQLSKQQARKKYFQLLETDPMTRGQVVSRKLQGASRAQTQSNYEGITWGISDETQVYAYRNDEEFPIEPDVIRRLPGLDNKILDKIAQYENRYRNYDQIQSQLNELVSKEKKQFGLDEKAQSRKQKLQKKLVESVQALEKCEDWIKVNVFGENTNQNKIKGTKKLKEGDTFSDDQFFDRTLEQKHKRIETRKQNSQQGQATTRTNPTQMEKKGGEIIHQEDIWQLKSRYEQLIVRKMQLQRQEKQAKQGLLKNKQNTQSQNRQLIENEHKDGADSKQIHGSQQDELELFMKENQQSLFQETKSLCDRELLQIHKEMSQLKNKLMEHFSQKQLNRLEDKASYQAKFKDSIQFSKQSYLTELEVQKEKQRRQDKEKLAGTLQELERIQEQRRMKQDKIRSLQQQIENLSEEDPKVLQLYSQLSKLQQQFKEQGYVAEESEEENWGQPRKITKPNQVQENSKTSSKLEKGTKSITVQQLLEEQKNQEQKVIDLTSRFS